MERGFQRLLFTGKAAAGDDNFSPLAYSDEAYINRNTSFPTFNFDKSLLSLMPYAYGSSYDNTSDFNLRSRITGDSSKEERKWRCIEAEEKLKRLKHEPSSEQFNFTPMFGQLPELQSLEQVNQETKRFKQSFSPLATTVNPHLLEPTLTQFRLAVPNYITPVPLRQIKPPVVPPPAKLSVRDQARKRRNTLSDKARTLQKVLPWDKKMDMATIYEETYKYIKFLQAQISVLQSMPVASSSSSPLASGNPRQSNQYGGLGKLNRQQLLEVLVNSPSAQTILYSKGCCIYSLEQLILFKDIAEKNFFVSGPSMFS